MLSLQGRSTLLTDSAAIKLNGIEDGPFSESVWDDADDMVTDVNDGDVDEEVRLAKKVFSNTILIGRAHERWTPR